VKRESEVGEASYGAVLEIKAADVPAAHR